MKNDEKNIEGQIPGEELETTQGFWTKDRILQVITLVFVIALFIVIVWQRKNIAEFSLWLANYAGLKYLGIFILSTAASATLIIPIPGLAMTPRWAPSHPTPGTRSGLEYPPAWAPPQVN